MTGADRSAPVIHMPPAVALPNPKVPGGPGAPWLLAGSKGRALDLSLPYLLCLNRRIAGDDAAVDEDVDHALDHAFAFQKAFDRHYDALGEVQRGLAVGALLGRAERGEIYPDDAGSHRDINELVDKNLFRHGGSRVSGG